MPYMRAPYPSTINSTSGHCLVATEPNQIMHVPQDVVPEAIAIGWQPSDPPEAAPVESPPEPSHNATETQSDEVDDYQVELDQAVLRIITRNDNSDFKNDGTPKLTAVAGEMSPDVPRPKSRDVKAAFEKMQDNIDLATD